MAILEGEQANAVELALEHPLGRRETLLGQRRGHRFDPLGEDRSQRRIREPPAGVVMFRSLIWLNRRHVGPRFCRRATGLRRLSPRRPCSMMRVHRDASFRKGKAIRGFRDRRASSRLMAFRPFSHVWCSLNASSASELGSVRPETGVVAGDR